MKSSTIAVIVIVILVLIGGAWYVYSSPALAMKLGLRSMPPQTTMASTTPSHRGGMRGGFAMGSIEVLNDNGFTITLSDGTTKDIDITATTTLQNYATASSTPTTITADQLSVGEQVSVVGAPNPDGSINAVRVMTGTPPARPTGGHYGQTGALGANGMGVPKPE